jgi:catechol 2,3-dioxygenase-like lactoylglutathione lyase family enzyme
VITKSYCINVAVRDLDAAVRTYEQVLGIEAIPKAAGFDPWGGARGVDFPIGGPYSLALVTVDEPAADSPNPASRHLATRGDGVYLVGLLVDDVDAHQRHLAASGIPLLTPEAVPTEAGRSVFTDPDHTAGTVLQFTQFDDPGGEEQRWSKLVRAAQDRRAYQSYVLDIAVRDLAASVKTYSDAFGIEAIPMPDGADPSESMDASHFTVGGPAENGIGGLYAIGLMTPRGTPKGPIPQAVNDYLDAHGEGSFLVAFLTEDLDRQQEHLRSLGIGLCYDEPMRYVHGILQMTTPVHGVWLDFAQHDHDAFERWQSGE